MKHVKIYNPFKNLTLDAQEREWSRSVESGEWKPIKNFAREKKRIQTIAKATFEKTRNINLRLSERDIFRLKAKAMEEGIPYQTLASSLLHKYAGS